jgi:hypothetical protein
VTLPGTRRSKTRTPAVESLGTIAATIGTQSERAQDLILNRSPNVGLRNLLGTATGTGSLVRWSDYSHSVNSPTSYYTSVLFVRTEALLGYGLLLGIERPKSGFQEILQFANLFEHLSMFYLRPSDHANRLSFIF